MTDLIIVGASGFGREVLQMVRDINAIHESYNVLGFIDDNLNALDNFECGGVKVLGKISDWKPIADERYALAIAAPKIKEKVVTKLLSQGCEFETIFHPSSVVKDFTSIGEGVIFFARVGVSVNVEIGNFVFLNSDVGVGHDAKIGDFCTVMPKCNISGATVLGRCVNVGAMAATLPGVKAGDYSTIGMNSAVIRNVESGATVMGVPAKRIL